ncbi:alpha-1,4-glucan--maltose-1-phosphate maltosyltransferase [Zavarzinia sp. CC-PAN008]|uniref:alpha-1,4-glucan--maltose-1-phosphate maltosyltransferase n=1 Tax=Zavarzinia sp. CC-PAN008 TaxID=3243332 RepID=UPI003F743E97
MPAAAPAKARNRKVVQQPQPTAQVLDPVQPWTDRARPLIEDVWPIVDGGRHAVKRIDGDIVDVWADVFSDGHEVLAVEVQWRTGDGPWQAAPMRLLENDRWTGRFPAIGPGRLTYRIAAWTDTFATWRREVELKRAAGQDVSLECREGAMLLQAAPGDGPDGDAIARALGAFEASGEPAVLLQPTLAEAMSRVQARSDIVYSEGLPMVVDRPRAGFAAWYTMVPRSQGQQPGQGATFDDCVARLPDIAAMGFDTLYLLPIHPIGLSHRKGRNNAVTAEPGEPGSPYAIGGAEGGHDAVHPELGGMDGFRRLVAEARGHGMEVALDFAIQCSPDHPWLKEHPDWFRKRPDGTIRYAENPPKKYQDIVNVDFHGADAGGLWQALLDVTLFWVDQGVRCFRVDNPHTKPFRFWEWLIAEVKRRDPGVIFLSEAFTRPKVMKALAKIGFTQSYTYFTWRTGKQEFIDYLTELTTSVAKEYMQPNFMPTTPDILPWHLQNASRGMFMARAGLAATLSGVWGMLNGYELCEATPVPNKEEYLDSEKYEFKVRDWNAPGNIKDFLARLNRSRQQNPALQQTRNLRFVAVDDDQILGFVKESKDHHNVVAVAVALQGGGPRTFWFHFGDLEVGPPEARARVAAVENLATGERQPIEWGGVRMTIDPEQDPVMLLRCLTHA